MHSVSLLRISTAKHRFDVLGQLSSPVALAWPSYTEQRSVFAMTHIPLANSLEEFIKYASLLDGSAEAITFATIDGHIGFLVSGKIPKRQHIEYSTVLRDGTNKSEDWLEYVPVEEMPRVVNPENGYIVSCNNKVSPWVIKGAIGTTGPNTARALRANEIILEYINKNIPITETLMMEMQMDTVDITAKHILPILLSIVDRWREGKKEKRIEDVVRILRNWDYDMSSSSTGGLIYEVWIDELKKGFTNCIYRDKGYENVVKDLYTFHYYFTVSLKLIEAGEYPRSICYTGIDDIINALKNTYERIVSVLGTHSVIWLIILIEELEMGELKHYSKLAHAFFFISFKDILSDRD